MNPTLLAGKTILVTGAGDGLGKEAAKTYAALGAQVSVVGRPEAKLQQVVADIELAASSAPKPSIVVMDLATIDDNDCKALANLLQTQFGHLDGVLNNAGLLGQVAPMLEQSPSIWQSVMQVNVNATFMLSQALLPLLLAAPHGSLVFTSSSVGRKGRAQWGAYAASKFATEGMMQVLAEEYQDSTLRINSINPGGTRTSMRQSAFPSENANKLKTPADIMAIYVKVMSDESIGMNGCALDAQANWIPGSVGQ
jgi:NAD(P)-dependent dehydrogenase (short-subunit alcohol dehydrogenase family)